MACSTKWILVRFCPKLPRHDICARISLFSVPMAVPCNKGHMKIEKKADDGLKGLFKDQRLKWWETNDFSLLCSPCMSLVMRNQYFHIPRSLRPKRPHLWQERSNRILARQFIQNHSHYILMPLSYYQRGQSFYKSFWNLFVFWPFKSLCGLFSAWLASLVV